MTAYYNEIDQYAAQWLRNLISKNLIAPGDVDERSIVDVHADDLKSYTQCHFFAGIGGWSLGARLAGWPDDRPLWSGSCPCQPFSVAGKGEGQADERHLWPEQFRLIRARRPIVWVGEQVAAAVGKHWLDGVYADLEGIRYTVRAAIVPACAVDAPHRRDRAWIVADADASERGEIDSLRGRVDEQHPVSQGQEAASRSSAGGPVDDTISARLERQRRNGHDGNQSGWFDPQQIRSVASAGRTLPDADQLSEGERRQQRSGELGRIGSNSGNRPWTGMPFAVGADGKARRVEPGIRLLAHGVPARVGKLRAYGNAIVPQVAAEVIGAYLDDHPLKAKAEEERHSPPGRSAPSIGSLHGSAWLPKEQGSET